MRESLSSRIRLPTFSEKNTGFLHVQSEVIDFCILYFFIPWPLLCYSRNLFIFIFENLKKCVYPRFLLGYSKKSLKWKLLGLIFCRFEIHAILKGTQTWDIL